MLAIYLLASCGKKKFVPLCEDALALLIMAQEFV